MSKHTTPNMDEAVKTETSDNGGKQQECIIKKNTLPLCIMCDILMRKQKPCSWSVLRHDHALVLPPSLIFIL